MKNYEVVVTQQAGSVNCDFQAARAYLKERLAEYNGAVFTEDSKAYAKKTVAELRKEKKAFSDRVKEVKAEYMKPYEKFETQAKELIVLYDEPIEFINSQVVAFERERVEKKKQRIAEIYDSYMKENEVLKPYLPLERIYNPKWENTTTSEKSINAEIQALLAKTYNDLSTIKEMHSCVEGKALEMYKETLDVTASIRYLNNYENQRREILAREQERARTREEERIRREEREKIAAEKQVQEAMKQAMAEAKQEAEQEIIAALVPEEIGVSELYKYRLTLTESQKEALEIYMNSVGIVWEEM
jgi:hypothetical protein